MPTPFESATLNLKLFELRREPVLREARAWFVRDFNPASLGECLAMMSGDRNASIRMVLGYWDMAASLVTTGAIDQQAFLAAHTEVVATFAKIAPYLAEVRRRSETPGFCRHLEQVVLSIPDAEATLVHLAAGLRSLAAARSHTGGAE
jgi:hypothetical protein